MLLAGKNAVIYGAAGAIGAAVARAFAAEGASVFLTGRNAVALESVAKEITASGGSAHTAVVDATDEDAVESHAGAVAAQGGSLDISFRPSTWRTSRQTILSSTWPANHHHPKPAGDCAGQPLKRVFERHKTELRVYDALAVGRKTVAELHADLGLQPPCCRVVCGAAYPMKSEPTA